MMAADGTVPDLLRRFTPTPHRLKIVLDDISLTLQTNDPDLIVEMKAVGRRAVGHPKAALRLKVIRDYDVPGRGTDIITVSAGPVTSIIVGTCSVLALDCQRRGILGFLATSVTADMFTHHLLPLLLDRLRHYSNQTCTTRFKADCFSQKSDNSAIAH